MKPAIARIQAAVCRHYSLPPEVLIGPSRARHIARSRQVGMYLAQRFTVLSYPEIGRRFGGRHHSTAIHAVRRIAALRAANPEINADIIAITASIMERAR